MIIASTGPQASFRPDTRLRAKPVAAYRQILPALLLFYSMVVPMEVRFSIAEQAFYPPRIAALLLLPWLMNKLASGGLKFKPIDSLMLFGVAWMMLSFMLYYDAATGFIRSAPLAFDVIIPYLVARIVLRNLTDLRRFLILITPGIAFAGGTMALESVTHTAFVKPFAASVFGRLSNYENGVAVGAAEFFQRTRLGLLRASGPFSHPILGGIFLASFIPLYLRSGIKGAPRWWALAGTVCSFFSLSSGAFLVIILGVGIVVLDILQRLMKSLDWRHLTAGIISVLIGVQMFSQNGVVPILIRYTLDPATGYYRQLIWEYGSASVVKHPWIGIGYTDFERAAFMGTSVDHHWLLLALRHGLPAVVAIGAVCIWSQLSLMRTASRKTGIDRSIIVALAAAGVAMIIAGFTVTYFGSALTLFYFVIGLCVNIGLNERAPQPKNSDSARLHRTNI